MSMREKLSEAIEASKNDVKSFVWKLARNKQTGEQEEIRLVDATDEQLNTFYNHCMSMLYSKDKLNPGRYTLLDIIKDQRAKCNVELFLRDLESGRLTADGKPYPRYLYWQDCLDYMNKNKEYFPSDKLKEISVSAFSSNLPREYTRISVDLVRDACLAQLGTFDSKHITFSFILNMGVFLTPAEMKELDEKDAEGKTRSKLEVLKERLNIKPSVRLMVKPSGLNFTELRAMIKLSNKSYSTMSTDQLITLRNKVLFKLEDEVKYHVQSWEDRVRQLELVAKDRGITLTVC